MPTNGNSRNPASGGPRSAPVVLAAVSHAVARVSGSTAFRIALPSSVKKTPDSSEGSAVRTAANHKTRLQSPTCVPDVSDSKPAYEAITTQPVASDTTMAARSGARSANSDPASPPNAIPPSTTASIRLAASVVLSTYIVRKRNHTTSSASSAIPDRKAHTRNVRRGNAEAAELADALEGFSGRI